VVALEDHERLCNTPNSPIIGKEDVAKRKTRRKGSSESAMTRQMSKTSEEEDNGSTTKMALESV